MSRRDLLGQTGGGGGNSARYWRIIPVDGPDGYSWYTNYGAWYHDIRELKMFSSADGTGADLAFGKVAVAQSEYSSTYAAGKALDGNTTTRWASSFSPPVPQWWYVDLVTAAEVHSIDYYGTKGDFLTEHLYPINFHLQYSSDATIWTTQNTITTVRSAVSQLFTGL